MAPLLLFRAKPHGLHCSLGQPSDELSTHTKPPYIASIGLRGLAVYAVRIPCWSLLGRNYPATACAASLLGCSRHWIMA